MADGGILLRIGGSTDIAAVARVIEESFDATYGEAWTGPQCAGALGLPGAWLTLAMGNDGVEAGVIGFALARSIVDEAELLLIGVRPAFRRAGVGGALLAHTRDTARARGAQRLFLEVRDGNPAAKLYKRAGFSQIGRRSAYYRGGSGMVFDALSLAMSLDTSPASQGSSE